MIIGTTSLYLRYDPAEELNGVVPGAIRSWGSQNNNTYTTRGAPEDLPWETRGFIDKLIKSSTRPKNDDNDNELKSDDSDEELVERLSNVRVTRRVRSRSPVPVDETPFRVEPATTDQVSDVRVWQLVRNLGWVDRDEIVRTQRYVFNRMNRKNDRRELLGGMLRLIAPLQAVFEDIAALSDLPDEDQMNFFGHVIGKGEDFYKFVLQCPDVSMYLFNGKVQNLFTFLRLSV